MTSYSEMGFNLRTFADEANDAADHDELHAAAEVARLLAGDSFETTYIDRWLEGLHERLGL